MKSYQKFFYKNELLVIAVLAFLIYFFLAVIKPIGIFWSLDEGGKWIYIENVLRTGNPRAVRANVAGSFRGHLRADLCRVFPVTALV